MIQDYTASNTQHLGLKSFEIDKLNAYRQAGFAASIYLGNKQKKLPAVFFRIVLKEPHNTSDENGRLMSAVRKCNAKLEGGRLIQNLPLSFAGATDYFSRCQQEQFRCAFEADVINLLAGFLAEAKYVAKEGDEEFSANLINLDTLRFYGDSSGLEFITHYMECFLTLKEERERKMAELFLSASAFVNQQTNWKAITSLANYITDYLLDESKDIISCEEVMALLESCIATKQY